jgi:L-alanine-DL-glutamate epimerase-like enolase superfamily enzyme
MAGGVSEWMRSAHMAQAFDTPVLPVWFSNLHVHLAAAVPHCLAVEYFMPSEGTFPFESLVCDPVPVVDGMIKMPERPGHGIEFSDSAVRKFRVG